MWTHGSPLHRRELAPLLRSVVKVLCVSDTPNPDQPWQTLGPSSSTGSGCIVATKLGPRVLTNAHCVENHVFVEVRRYGNAHTFVAEVEAVSQTRDLALLEVDDPAFFHGTAPIALGPLPRLGERVAVCGYPIGGDRLSITEGIVSRVELVPYAQSRRKLLAVQIDAAINSGNSGGPVILGGRLAGVAFQALEGAETIEYVVAPPVVEHFPAEVADGRESGFPALGITTQSLEARAHRRALGLEGRRGGVLVTQVEHGGSSFGVIEPDDVLLELDGVEVARDGTVPLREGEVVELDHLVATRRIGERIGVRLLRGGHEVEGSVVLGADVSFGGRRVESTRPSYFVVGGLVFVPLSQSYLASWGEDWERDAPRSLVALLEHGRRSGVCEEPVVLHKVLADRVNQGYHDVSALLVDEVDGVRVRSLAHLATLVDEGNGDFLRIVAATGQRIVLDRREVHVRHEAVLRRFGVPSDRSPELVRRPVLAGTLRALTSTSFASVREVGLEGL
jgi:S1-C subfamily serine protease